MKLTEGTLTTLVFVLAALLPLMAGDKDKNQKHPEVDFSISCQECHQETSPQIYQEWKDSAHGVMNYGCYLCHGDGQEEFAAKPGSERCVGCHSPQEVDFSKLAVDNCFDCHQGHSLKFHQE